MDMILFFKIDYFSRGDCSRDVSNPKACSHSVFRKIRPGCCLQLTFSPIRESNVSIILQFLQLLSDYLDCRSDSSSVDLRSRSYPCVPRNRSVRVPPDLFWDWFRSRIIRTSTQFILSKSSSVEQLSNIALSASSWYVTVWTSGGWRDRCFDPDAISPCHVCIIVTMIKCTDWCWTVRVSRVTSRLGGWQCSTTLTCVPPVCLRHSASIMTTSGQLPRRSKNNMFSHNVFYVCPSLRACVP